MRPGLFLVCDPYPGRARAAMERMLSLAAPDPDATLRATEGDDWACAVVRPCAAEPTSGAAILRDGLDVLVWTGEIFLPRDWQTGEAACSGARAAARKLLERLRNEGEACVAELDGSFCGAWYDARRRRWTVFTDRMAALPVFWSAEDDRLVVAPQAWLAWRGRGGALRVDARGVADLLRTQNVTDDHTLIDGVHWLPRGHALVWGEEGAGYLRTWDLEYRGARTHDADEALDGYLAAINGAIDRHSRAHGRLSLGISGGLDSRIYLAICAELGRVPECFTAGWSFYEDVRYGRKLARLAGATHAVAELDERIVTRVLPEAIIATDGLQSAAHLAPTAACWDYARQAGGVLLEGFFHGMVGGCAVPADEDVCGNVPPHATAWARGLLHTGGSVDIIDGLLRPELAEESYARWCGRIDEIHRDAPADDLLSRAEYTLVSSRRGRVDVMGTALLRDGALVRNPAADRAMVEWHQRTAPELRRGRAIYLAALRRRFPAYARVPRADGCFGLPVSTNRFWREYHWQMGKLRRRLIERHYPWTQAWGSGNAAIRAWVFDVWRRSGGLDILLDRRARVLEWVRRDALRQLWQRAVANPLEAQPILTLATLEVMLRWLDGLAGRSFEASASSQLLWSRPQSMRSPAAAPAVCAAAV